MDVQIVEYELGPFELLLWLGVLGVVILNPLAILAAVAYVIVSLVRNRGRKTHEEESPSDVRSY